MAYRAEIVADSVSPDGHRLTTFETTFPRMVLAEYNTHRVFSRNSASSRAIPVWKQMEQLIDDPFVPIYWGATQGGMQAESEISPENILAGKEVWLETRDRAILGAFALLGGVDTLDRLADETKGPKTEARIKRVKEKVAELTEKYGSPYVLPEEMHKQIPNRILEPWVWHTVITTATEWDNFFALRANREAQPEIEHIANMMQALYDQSVPREVPYESWHLPYVTEEDRKQYDELTLIKVGIACSARVSYLTHDGKKDVEADKRLVDERLYPSGHMSPFEHVARPFDRFELEIARSVGEFAIQEAERIIAAEAARLTVDKGIQIRRRARQIAEQAMFSGNFRGWLQYRKMLPNEDNFARILANEERVT